MYCKCHHLPLNASECCNWKLILALYQVTGSQGILLTPLLSLPDLQNANGLPAVAKTDLVYLYFRGTSKLLFKERI